MMRKASSGNNLKTVILSYFFPQPIDVKQPLKMTNSISSVLKNMFHKFINCRLLFVDYWGAAFA